MSLQSCPTLCDPIDGSPPGSSVSGILQARTLEWVAISFSNAWKWKWSCSVMSDSSRPHALQPTRFLHPWEFPGKRTGVGCHCLLRQFMLLCTKCQGHRILVLVQKEEWFCKWTLTVAEKLSVIRDWRVSWFGGRGGCLSGVQWKVELTH